MVYPWLAYGHIAPSIVYLLLAPIQLWRSFRNRHLKWHRRIGRVAITAGLVSGISAALFGLLLSYGGALQASAAVVFGPSSSRRCPSPTAPSAGEMCGITDAG